MGEDYGTPWALLSIGATSMRLTTLFIITSLFLLVGCHTPKSISASDELHRAEPPPGSESAKKDNKTTVEASFYGEGDGFAGKTTASGEKFNPNDLTAAHPTLPMGTKVKVTNKKTGKNTEVRINDRGPHNGRGIDLSRGAAEKVGLIGEGTGLVEVEPK